jgi:predicted ATP-grasp superfamily ATP-dependent carboligase
MAGEPEPYIVEVIPDIPHLWNLLKRAYGLNVYSLHVMGDEGKLPAFSMQANDKSFYGKGIVFARSDIEIKNTDGWSQRE